MSEFQERLKRQMTGGPPEGQADENRAKRRHEGTRSRRPASQQQQRQVGTIMASIMGDQNRAHSTGASGGPRSESATSASGAGGRQHKLKQRFTVIRKLGKGTYGKVQLAINKETGQEVAIKTIKKTKIENEQDLERVRREIQIMSSIEHPHIVHIYEVFENKDKIVLIMQYAPGGELYEYLSQSKVLDEHEARRLFRQIATAVFYCHQNKICHRDLKLENILLDEKNNAKIADFGLSNVFDKSRQLQTFCGSPLYASPEIVQSSPYEGPEVDCWSLGVILYTLVYGAMPFDGRNFKLLVKQISEASYYEPEQRSAASALIGRLLCASPQQRATILDVCSDPWVNGLLAPHHSPRYSPTSGAGGTGAGGAQHPSLLKVAQDMANLTPVRLDILLSLTPQADPAQEATGAPVDPHTKLADSNQRQIIQPAREHQRPDKIDRQQQAQQQQQQQQQEKERAALIDQLGAELNAVADEARPTSPVASYVVRDLGPAADATAGQPETEAVREQSSLGAETEPTIEEEIEKLEELANRGHLLDEPARVETAETGGRAQGDSGPVGPEADAITATATDRHDEPRPQSASRVTAELETAPANEAIPHPGEEVPSKLAALEKVPVEEPAQLVEPTAQSDASAHDNNKPDDQVAAMNVEVEVGPPPADGAKTQVEPEGEIARQAERSERACESQAANEVEREDRQADEEKPKKVKKRIVVVKKRRKVVRKDEGQLEEQKGADQRLDGVKSDVPQESAKKVAPKQAANSVPGKVRIPETFAATEQSAQPATVQTVAPKQTAARRTSALITDVSQKLLLQQQNQTTSSSAIEQDQTQLASVRVSDKRSEFERRSSLATQSASGAPRECSRQEGALDEDGGVALSLEPECHEAKRELVRLPSAIEPPQQVEAVDRLQPLGFGQLCLVPLDSEPLTPTNPRKVGTFDETTRRLSECAERLSSETGDQVKEDERSDSVETIKGEGLGLDEPLEGAQKSKNIRSSLQIDLSRARNEDGTASAAHAGPESSSTPGSLVTAASSGGGLGPAPITRSYKKVTFTKDGTCITETGRIYSTQADDGTMRRVERKSKVTHYPSDDAASAAGTAREETTTHEEIVYESAATGRVAERAHEGFWPRANSRAPLERLIMPSSDLYEDDGHGEFTYQRRTGDSHFGTESSRPPPMERADSASSCSSGSTDVFDDIFDTWTGAISMFGPRRHPFELRNSLASRAFVTGSPLPFGRQHSALSRHSLGTRNRPQSSAGGQPEFFPRHHQQQQQAHPGSASIGPRQRCESVEPGTGAFEHQQAGRQRRHHRRPPSTGASDYESEAPHPFERFRPSLGSARGCFGSSSLFAGHAEPANHLAMDPFLDEEPASLFERMELEHERLRHKFAQKRKQLWKGSTPALNEIPEFQAGPAHSAGRWSTSSRERPPPQHDQHQHQQPANKRTSVIFQMAGSGGSGGSLGQLRQSTPLDAAPVRRNTANLAEHLPPGWQQQQQHLASNSSGQFVCRSNSKTSSITSQLANIRLSEPGGQQQQQQQQAQQQQQQQRSASFIGLKRNSSASLSQPSAQLTQTGAGESTGSCAQRQAPGSAVSSAAAPYWTDERAPLSAAAGHSMVRLALGQSRDSAEANSRIQNWLRESAGNLSVSSGSKSSASDATLPSSGRSDTAYLASSAGQMAPLRRDESIRTTTTSSLSAGAPHHHHRQQHQQHQQQPQQQHKTCSTQSRTIMGQASHQLPPAPSRSPGGRRDTEMSPMFQRMPPVARPVSSTLIVRSSSKQSISEQPDGRVECHKITQEGELSETIVSADGSRGHHESRQRTTTSSSAVVSQKMFAFPSEAMVDWDGNPHSRQQEQEQQQQRLVETRQEVVTSTRQQVFSQRAMSPVITTFRGAPQDDWFGQATATKDGTETGGRLFGGCGGGGGDDFDSFGDLESVCSSSLLEQLRARGYKSIIDQRMGPSMAQQPFAAPAGRPEQQQQQPNNAVTASSTSTAMSSSSDAPQGRSPAAATAQHQGGAPCPGDQSQRDQAQQAPASDAVNANSNSQLAPGSQPTEGAQTTQMESQDATTKVAIGAEEEAQAAPIKAHPGESAASKATGETQTEEPQTEEPQTEEPEEQDEDVREAKANIREHLERMRETQKFLKTMHEQEEKFQRQFQEMLHFDNLLLSAKLNGIKPSMASVPPGGHFRVGSLDDDSPPGPMSSCRALRSGFYSAPVAGHLHDHPQANGFMSGASAEPQAATGVAPAGAQVSCFSSDLFRPTASALTTSLVGGPRTVTADPLEPVQPISVHAYAPPARHWHRSKSQLGDQFSSGGYRARRPLSAKIDTSPSTTVNAYFPSRQRRSLSQVRYSHHHNNPSVLAHPDMNRYDSRAPEEAGGRSPRAIISEYRSSFGPNLAAADHRLAGSPRLASSRVRSDRNKVDDSDGDDDDDDLGLSSYRASSYVPRTVSDLDSMGGRGGTSRTRSYGWRKGAEGASEKTSNGTSDLSPPRPRRSSCMQSLSGGLRRERAAKQELDSDSAGESSPTRRKSWAHPQEAGNRLTGGQQAPSSRLSELEQRIQANKKRREELLLGINSGASGATSSSRPARVARRASVRGLSENEDNADEDSDQSFGFERPSRPFARASAEASTPSGDDPPAAANGGTGATAATRASSGVTARTSRPSRLESMEARIKRRSYCIKLSSPDRARTRGGASSASAGGSKWPAAQKEIEAAAKREE